ncbi:MAG TPA: hypothetical protein VNK92_07990 [Vicinamibacterales bacterium]|nr:hypothetical protein [Vicinamibacterales bacterium]
MTTWDHLFLGIIAAATLAMAVLQVGAVLAASRLARRTERLVDQLAADVRPLLARASAIADDAARAAALAAAQAERLDRVTADLARRVDETADVLQRALVNPAREGLALIAALRAGLAALRGASGRRVEEEDALFIG